MFVYICHKEMTMKQNLRLPVALLVILGCTTLARAADVGATTLPKDHFNKAHAEIIYESVDRDLDNDSSLEADALYLRLHTAVGQTATLDFDIGGLDAQDADATLYGGLGLRYLVYDAPAWRIGAHLQVHYAPDIETDLEKSDLLEVDGGISLLGRIRLADDLVLMPYIGPVFSIVRIDGDAEVGDGKESFDLEEDSPIGVAAGLALQLPEGNTLRVEARAFDGVSFSAAAGIAF